MQHSTAETFQHALRVCLILNNMLPVYDGLYDSGLDLNLQDIEALYQEDAGAPEIDRYAISLIYMRALRAKKGWARTIVMRILMIGL